MNLTELHQFIKKVLNETNNDKTISRVDNLSKNIGNEELIKQIIRRIDDHKLNEILDQIEIEFDSRKI